MRLFIRPFGIPTSVRQFSFLIRLMSPTHPAKTWYHIISARILENKKGNAWQHKTYTYTQRFLVDPRGLHSGRQTHFTAIEISALWLVSQILRYKNKFYIFWDPNQVVQLVEDCLMAQWGRVAQCGPSGPNRAAWVDVVLGDSWGQARSMDHNLGSKTPNQRLKIQVPKT